jgi:predicted Zn-dependent protease
MLGLQYLWKTGYDPTSALDMFERIESTERRQPGAVSKLFRSHPLTPDRIAKTQKNIEEMLPGRKEYVLNTSEYEEVRERLADLGNAAKTGAAKTDAPVLRRGPSATVNPGKPKGTHCMNAFCYMFREGYAQRSGDAASRDTGIM